MSSCELNTKHCKPCEGGIKKLNTDQAKNLLDTLNGWQLSNNDTAIAKRFEFKGFNKVMSFINAIAWIVNTEMHHPDISFGYNYCEVTFTTHAINGLSENDFICAAKIDQLFS